MKAAALAAALVAAGPALAQTVAPASVVVVGLAPLPGIELPRDRVAAAVQSASGADFARSGADSPADYMARYFGGVQVNELQGNPFQPDVNYRGYTASPLLGTAQGLSVYLDGLRLNQPFGDVVSWDLIPKAAIAGLTLMPGSNPLWGLNTLGGALVLQTKDGRRHAGGAAELSAGSHGRVQVGLERGGSDTDWSWYGAANAFHENGWRAESPSDVGQLFGKLGRQLGDSELTLTLAHARSRLLGNGLQEQTLLAADRASIYSAPDATRNRASLALLAFRHDPGEGRTLSGQAYVRTIDGRTLNGDVNDDALGAAPGEEPACNGVLTNGRSVQRQAGAGVQATWRLAFGSARHELLAGAALDSSRVRYRQQQAPGRLDAARRVAPCAVESEGDGEGEGDDAGVALDARTRTASLYAGDTVTLAGGVQLALSLRHDRVSVHNRDRLRPAPDPASLDGDHVFGRTHPALGIVWPLGAGTQAWAGANEGSRAPTAIELGCANPERPCRLPNAMAGDPPLKAVITRTFEAGLRGGRDGTRWSLGLFRADNRDDLLFVAGEAAGYGYFRNVARTRRQGLEASASARWGALDLQLHYSLLDARFRSAERLLGAANSSQDAAGTIAVQPGDRIPLLPRQLLKAALRWRAGPSWDLDLDALASAGALARGNENGAHRPDGSVYLGPGRSAGYALVNLGSQWRAAPGWSFFVQVKNLFDRRYASAAQLGATAFDAQGRFEPRPLPALDDGRYPRRGSTFYAPGAPRALALGLRYRFE